MGARSSKNTTQNNRSDGHLLEYFRNTFVRGGGGTNSNIIPFSASGGTEIPAATAGNGYKYHVYTSLGSFTVSGNVSKNVEFIVVGGAGGGGYDVGGGGGGGGIAYASSYPMSSGSYPIVIGGGGAADIDISGNGGTGTDTTFTIGASTIYGKGGGGGGSYNATPGNSGGSGGGGSGYDTPGNPGTANQPSQPTFGGLITNYGNPGGLPGPGSPARTGGGGGGAGGPGGAAVSISQNSGSADGGVAQPFPAFGSPYIAPAVPAPAATIIGPTGLFGAGGRAYADNAGPPYGGNNVNTTGNGGSGAGNPNIGESGGAGIVIIRYLDP